MTYGIIYSRPLPDGRDIKVIRQKGDINLYCRISSNASIGKLAELYIFQREGVALTFAHHYDHTLTIQQPAEIKTEFSF